MNYKTKGGGVHAQVFASVHAKNIPQGIPANLKSTF